MLIKPIYELLPSGYLAAGGSSMLLLEPLLAQAGGLLLFTMGALVWVLRSNYRRLDRGEESRTTLQKRFFIPEYLYEFIPFAYFAAALLVLGLKPDILLLALACLLSCRGALLLYRRAMYRRTRPRWQPATNR